MVEADVMPLFIGFEEEAAGRELGPDDVVFGDGGAGGECPLGLEVGREKEEQGEKG